MTAAALEAIPVFYSPRMAVNIESFSPSAAKPREAVKSWLALVLPITVMEPTPVSREQFYLAHDRSFVDGVLSGQLANGFGSTSMQLANSLQWTSGALLSATRAAIGNGCAAVAPAAGFHHACHDHAGGYCTFNGLMISACVLLHEGIVTRVGILDLDHHYGDGTQDILSELRLESRVLHYSAGAKWHRRSQAKSFLNMLPSLVEEFAGCDVLLAQLAADPHVDDPLGGWLTTPQLMQRDTIVFQTCKRIGLPIAWCLGGGYLTPLRKTLDIHDGTMLACARTFAPKRKVVL